MSTGSLSTEGLGWYKTTGSSQDKDKDDSSEEDVSRNGLAYLGRIREHSSSNQKRAMMDDQSLHSMEEGSLHHDPNPRMDASEQSLSLSQLILSSDTTIMPKASTQQHDHDDDDDSSHDSFHHQDNASKEDDDCCCSDSESMPSIDYEKEQETAIRNSFVMALASALGMMAFSTVAQKIMGCCNKSTQPDDTLVEEAANQAVEEVGDRTSQLLMMQASQNSTSSLMSSTSATNAVMPVPMPGTGGEQV